MLIFLTTLSFSARFFAVKLYWIALDKIRLQIAKYCRTFYDQFLCCIEKILLKKLTRFKVKTEVFAFTWTGQVCVNIKDRKNWLFSSRMYTETGTSSSCCICSWVRTQAWNTLVEGDEHWCYETFFGGNQENLDFPLNQNSKKRQF